MAQALNPIMRKALSQTAELPPETLAGILAYRCSNGHVFVAPTDGEKAKQRGAGE
jgi:hypothetical protein